MGQPQYVPRIHSTSLIVIPARMASTRLPRKMLSARDGEVAAAAHIRGGQSCRSARGRVRGDRS